MVFDEKFADVYGYNVCIEMLRKDGFTMVSNRDGSVPSIGSPCRDINKLSPNDNVVVERAIKHKDDSVTLVTDYGWLRFWKI